MKRLTALLFAIISLGFLQPLSASHVTGGDITYECLGNNNYRILLNLFRDCSGIPAPTNVTINFNSTCGNTSINMPLISSNEVSQLCPQDIQNSTCNNGSLPGMEMYIYEGQVNLTPCADWNMGYSLCCRNVTDNLVGSPSTWIDTEMNSVVDDCNNSPIFTAQPIPYFCINQPVTFDYGVIEFDGDSLWFDVVSARSAQFTNVTYSGGYSAINPINNLFTINNNTGQITFTPNALGKYVVVVKCWEYDANTSQLKGVIMREIQCVIINCSNQVPYDTSGVISNFVSTGGQLTGPRSIELCEGDSFCFDIYVLDPDSSDIVGLASNVTSALPGATFTWTPGNPAFGTICWQAPSNSSFFNTFNIVAVDDACPVFGMQAYIFDVTVLTSTIALSDQIICNGQGAQLFASGGSSFLWEAISGDSIDVGNNFSCDTCDNPIASPTQTTTYVVTSDLSGNCQNTDTVTITVAPDFTWTTDQIDSISCLYEAIQFFVYPDSSGNYHYQWSDGNMLDDDTIFNPSAIINASGTYTFYVTITSPYGCEEVDSFTVFVDTFYVPVVNAIANDSNICLGDTAYLNALLNPVQASCDYTIDMFDSFNDGWDGASLIFYVNNVPNGPYTVTGSNTTVTVPVNQGDLVDIAYTAGTNENQHTYFVYDGTNTLVFQDGPTPATGLVWSDTAFCGATLGTYTYQWIPSWFLNDDTIANPTSTPDSTITYTIIVTDINGGCIDSSEVTITVYPPNDPTIQSVPPLCENDPPYTLQAADTGGVWTSISSGINDPQPGDFNPSTAGAGSHWIVYTITNGGGCVFTDSIEVIVNAVPPAPTSVGGTFCPGVPLTGITANGTSITWYDDNGNVLNTGTDLTGYGFTSGNDTVYVTQTVNGCESDPTAVIIDVLPGPTADFTPNPVQGIAPLQVNFQNNSSGGTPPYTWNWDFAGLGSSNDFEPEFTFDASGIYPVTLIVTDDNGCKDQLTINVIVDGKDTLITYNVFSPNGDGINDVFMIGLDGNDPESLENFHAVIYNRWGAKIFEWNDAGKGWDGENHSDGTYYYVVTATGKYSGKEYKRQGYLSLIGSSK